MCESTSEDRTHHLLNDDNGDPIGTKASVNADGLHGSTDDGLEDAHATLTARELSELLAHRRFIEQAKGILMAVYGMNADEAFELLKLHSQLSNIKLRRIAEQLTEDLVALPRPERMTLRTWCDTLLLNMPARIDAS